MTSRLNHILKRRLHRPGVRSVLVPAAWPWPLLSGPAGAPRTSAKITAAPCLPSAPTVWFPASSRTSSWAPTGDAHRAAQIQAGAGPASGRRLLTTLGGVPSSLCWWPTHFVTFLFCANGEVSEGHLCSTIWWAERWQLDETFLKHWDKLLVGKRHFKAVCSGSCYSADVLGLMSTYWELKENELWQEQFNSSVQ